MTFHNHRGTGPCLPERRYKRGYNVNHLPDWLQKWLKEAEKSYLPASLLEAVLTVASVPAIAALYVYSVYVMNGVIESQIAIVAATMIGYILCSLFVARQQRGLELMVHDASHRAWCSSNVKLNNMFANLLVAYPVLSSVEAYWQSHRIHHGQFGSRLDPCRQRFAAMGLDHIDLSTKWKITCAVLKWIAPYNVAYYKEIGSLSFGQWGAFALWHLVILIFPTSAINTAWIGMSALEAIALSTMGWVFFWMIPFTLFLPVLRSIAESEEHDYEQGKTEFETTYTNIGWVHQLLIHPKNDAYHLIHHMFPSIPERRHRKVHKLLMKHDPKYRAALKRTSILLK